MKKSSIYWFFGSIGIIILLLIFFQSNNNFSPKFWSVSNNQDSEDLYENAYEALMATPPPLITEDLIDGPASYCESVKVICDLEEGNGRVQPKGSSCDLHISPKLAEDMGLTCESSYSPDELFKIECEKGGGTWDGDNCDYSLEGEVTTSREYFVYCNEMFHIKRFVKDYPDNFNPFTEKLCKEEGDSDKASLECILKQKRAMGCYDSEPPFNCFRFDIYELFIDNSISFFDCLCKETSQESDIERCESCINLHYEQNPLSDKLLICEEYCRQHMTDPDRVDCPFSL